MSRLALRPPRPGRAVVLGALGLLAACAGRRPAAAPGPAAPGPVAPDPGAPAALRILHFNDVYEIGPVEGGRSGGLARVATLRRALAGGAPPPLTTLGGDYLSPSALGTARVGGARLAGRQMVAALNALGLDVAVLGNHEFDVGEAAFRAHLAQARFAVLGANVADSAGRPFPGLRPHLVLTRQAGGRPVRVGVVGVVVPSNRPAWARLADPLEAARAAARRLRDSVDVLVALTHLSVDDDGRLAALAPEFDLILGGHEHENYALRRGPRLTPVLKADANARTVQVVDVAAPPAPAPAGARPSVTARLEPVTAALADDPATAAVVAAYTDSAFAGFAALGFAPRALVATVPEALDGRESTVRNGPSLLTRLVGAAMRREAPGAAVWLYNGGSIRVDDVVPAGPVTEYDVIRILPFGGRVVRAEVRGAALRRALDQGARNAGTGGYLHTDAVRSADGAWLVGGRPVADGAWYPVAVNDFLLTGQEVGLGFLARTGPDVRNAADGRDVRQAVIAELRARWP
jgi:5'-nucleotidase